MSTLVSSTNRRCPSRALAFRSRESPGAVAVRALAGPGSERLRCFKHFLRVARYFHLAPLASQDPGGVQQKRAALDAQILLTVQTLLLDDIELFAELLVRVAEQREGKFLLVDELIVRFHAVAGHTDDVHAGLAERTVEIPKILALAGAAGGHVLRVEVDQELAARGFLQRPGVAAARGQREVLYLAADSGSGHCVTISPVRGWRPG